MDRSLMCSPSANAARPPNSTARRFKTGNAPGRPRQTGHVFEFGSSPKRVEHPQKIFDSVLSCAWTSSPIIVSQLFNMVFGLWPLITLTDSPRKGSRTKALKDQRPFQVLRLEPNLRHSRVAGFVLQRLPLSSQTGALQEQIV